MLCYCNINVRYLYNDVGLIIPNVIDIDFIDYATDLLMKSVITDYQFVHAGNHC